MPQSRIRFMRVPFWQIILGAGLGLALLAAFFLLAIGIFLLLLPILAIAAGVFYLFGRRRTPVPRDRAAHERVIDAEYRVVDPERLDERRDRPR